MKKFIAGVIITGVVLLMSITAPDLIMMPTSGEYDNTSDSPIQASDTEGIKPGGFVNAKVTRIVDGDTVEAEFHDENKQTEKYKVRLLCIDTPETVKSGVDIQPYGKEATEKIRSMVLGKEVMLIFEKDIDDNYDRLLAYIVLKDGTCVNAALVEQGFARADIVRPNTVHKEYFYELQDKAISEKEGLWSLTTDKRPFIENENGYYVPRYIEN